jgi:hypothetical protein
LEHSFHAFNDKGKPVEVEDDNQEIEEDGDGSADSSIPGLKVPGPHIAQDQTIPAEWEHNNSKDKVAQEKDCVINRWESVIHLILVPH